MTKIKRLPFNGYKASPNQRKLSARYAEPTCCLSTDFLIFFTIYPLRQLDAFGFFLFQVS